MSRRLFFSVLAVFAMVVMSRTTAVAHDGHDHRIMGTVTMAAVDHMMLKDTNDKDVIVKVTKATRVKAKPAVKVEDIKPGTRVVVTATQEKDKSFTAKTIAVGSPAPAPPAK